MEILKYVFPSVTFPSCYVSKCYVSVLILRIYGINLYGINQTSACVFKCCISTKTMLRQDMPRHV